MSPTGVLEAAGLAEAPAPMEAIGLALAAAEAAGELAAEAAGSPEGMGEAADGG